MRNEHIYPQGTPASAVDQPCHGDCGCYDGDRLGVFAQLPEPVEVPVRVTPIPLYPYNPAALATCLLCLARLGPDWSFGGSSLDLAVLTHVTHRIAARGPGGPGDPALAERDCTSAREAIV